jgi:hypothetical protein
VGGTAFTVFSHLVYEDLYAYGGSMPVELTFICMNTASALTITPSTDARCVIDDVSIKRVTGGNIAVAGDLNLGGYVNLKTPVYEDLQFPVSSAKVPAANNPNWETFTANTAEYAFDVDEYIDTRAAELPHWWKQGTLGDCHIHFTIKTAQSSGANRYVKFQVVLAYVDVDEVWVEQTLTGEKTVPTGSAALTNFYVDLGDATFTNYLIGAQVKARIKRIAATGGTEYIDSVFITQFGIHLQRDGVGSTTETAK